MAAVIAKIDGREVVDYSTKETAQFIRAALKTAFPGVKFSVRTSYASMTSSTDVRWTDGPTVPEVDRIAKRFTSKSFDGRDDSTHYHTQTFEGREVSFSGWVHTTRETSAALLQKALDRYNVERARFGHGPAALEVKDGGFPHIVGADVSKLNPCGGSATWCPDAVYQFAYTMRANGVRIILKERA
jgi:hypothetical protein